MRSSDESVTLAADMSNVGIARRFVRASLASSTGGAADTAVADLVLVVSELVTNAIEHGSGPVVVSARVDGDTARVAVRSADDHGRVAPLDGWEPAAPERTSGRGLGIVQALADSVDVARIDGSLVITVTRRISPPPSGTPRTEV